MDTKLEKCVMVLDEELPLGVAANTAAILGITLGKKLPGAVGPDVTDQTGGGHLGIITVPVPVLRGSAGQLRALRERLYEPEFSELTVVDFSDLAQKCRTYGEFEEKMSGTPEGALRYFGIAVCGAKKKVNKLTGSLPLL